MKKNIRIMIITVAAVIILVAMLLPVWMCFCIIIVGWGRRFQYSLQYVDFP